MTTIMNDNTLNDKIDYKIDLQSSSKSVSNMSNMNANMNTTTSGTDKTQKIDYKIDLQSSSNSVSNTSNMNANMNATDNSQKIESKISNILIDKKDLKSNSISNIYKDEMTDFQLNDEITFDYETKKNLQGGVKITIEKITPKYINNYKKEYMKNIKKIDLKCEEDADDTNNEDMEEQQHQEQMEAYGYSKCAYCEKELPNDQIGEDDDGDKICLECNSQEEEDDDEEEEEEDEEFLKAEEEQEKQHNKMMGGMVEDDEEEEEEEDEETLLLKEQEKIAEKLAEIKYKKEAGERKQKVVEWLRKDNAIEMENYKRQIEDLKQKLAEKEVMVMNIEERLEKDDDELIGEMDFEEIYKTINKKTTKKTTKTDGKKTCVSKGDIRISSKVLRDKEKITMSGKWTTDGWFQAEYDKTDDLFYEINDDGDRIGVNNFENINKYGNHIFKNNQPEYEGKKNMWAVCKVKRGGKWISMLDLPIIEE